MSDADGALARGGRSQRDHSRLGSGSVAGRQTDIPSRGFRSRPVPGVHLRRMWLQPLCPRAPGRVSDVRVDRLALARRLTTRRVSGRLPFVLSRAVYRRKWVGVGKRAPSQTCTPGEGAHLLGRCPGGHTAFRWLSLASKTNVLGGVMPAASTWEPERLVSDPGGALPSRRAGRLESPARLRTRPRPPRIEATFHEVPQRPGTLFSPFYARVNIR